MVREIKRAFEDHIIQLPVRNILNLRPLTWHERNDRKYRQIATSIRTLGLVEPLVVYPHAHEMYHLLDGRKRLHALIRSGARAVDCLVATENESYTYNRRTNYLCPVSEHRMIIKALEHNSEKAIASALGIDVRSVIVRRDLLKGIHPKVVRIFEGRAVPPSVFKALQQMKPARQVATARLMVTTNDLTGRFAKAILAGTGDEVLKAPKGSRIRARTDLILDNLPYAEARYGETCISLLVAEQYVRRLLQDPAVHQYLKARHRRIAKLLADAVQAS